MPEMHPMRSFWTWNIISVLPKNWTKIDYLMEEKSCNRYLLSPYSFMRHLMLLSREQTRTKVNRVALRLLRHDAWCRYIVSHIEANYSLIKIRKALPCFDGPTANGSGHTPHHTTQLARMSTLASMWCENWLFNGRKVAFPIQFHETLDASKPGTDSHQGKPSCTEAATVHWGCCGTMHGADILFRTLRQITHRLRSAKHCLALMDQQPMDRVTHRTTPHNLRACPHLPQCDVLRKCVPGLKTYPRNTIMSTKEFHVHYIIINDIF